MPHDPKYQKEAYDSAEKYINYALEDMGELFNPSLASRTPPAELASRGQAMATLAVFYKLEMIWDELRELNSHASRDES